MKHTWPQGDPITMHTDSAGELVAFHWRGVPHRIEQVLNRQHVDTGWWDGAPISREYLTVTTTTGLLVTVFHDVASGEWKLHQLYD